ncbi:MAG: hypothetical protein IGS03_12045 [Candidatus Sericytochromatia bacterium]|nr:hypothetical protein [Candidatus Sericytochromatia bacterium]
MPLDLPPPEAFRSVVGQYQVRKSAQQAQTQPESSDTSNIPSDHLQIQHKPLLPPAGIYLQSMAQVEQILQELVQSAFPELVKEKLVLQPLQSRDVFFQSNFKPLSVLSQKPVYVIQVNPALFERQLPLPAARAILAHELAHTLDYHRHGLGGLAKVGWQVLFHNQHYEYRTDLQAIARGFGEGLIAYREWVYQQIPAADLAKKQKTYYQPAQIRQLMHLWEQAQAAGQAKSTLQNWLKAPPFLP